MFSRIKQVFCYLNFEAVSKKVFIYYNYNIICKENNKKKNEILIFNAFKAKDEGIYPTVGRQIGSANLENLLVTTNTN